MVKSQRKPWDRKGGETPKQFRAFATYRDMGADRTVVAVARVLAMKRGHVDRWARVHDWRQRATLWDEHLDQVRQKHLEACAAIGSEAPAPAEVLRAATISLETLSALVRRLLHRQAGSPTPERAG